MGLYVDFYIFGGGKMKVLLMYIFFLLNYEVRFFSFVLLNCEIREKGVGV